MLKKIFVISTSIESIFNIFKKRKKVTYGNRNFKYASKNKNSIMSNITKLGNAGIVWILLTIVLLLIPKTRKSGLILASALIVDLILCNGILKPLIARIRPFDVNYAIQLIVAKPHDYSFPSGHTAASFTAVMALYLAGEKKTWKAALVLAVLIALSRLYLYVHYPTDIIGGVVFGSLSGYLGYKIVEWIQKKKIK